MVAEVEVAEVAVVMGVLLVVVVVAGKGVGV